MRGTPNCDDLIESVDDNGDGSVDIALRVDTDYVVNTFAHDTGWACPVAESDGTPFHHSDEQPLSRANASTSEIRDHQAQSQRVYERPANGCDQLVRRARQHVDQHTRRWWSVCGYDPLFHAHRTRSVGNAKAARPTWNDRAGRRRSRSRPRRPCTHLRPPRHAALRRWFISFQRLQQLRPNGLGVDDDRKRAVDRRGEPHRPWRHQFLPRPLSAVRRSVIDSISFTSSKPGHVMAPRIGGRARWGSRSFHAPSLRFLGRRMA